MFYNPPLGNCDAKVVSFLKINNIFAKKNNKKVKII